MSLFHLEKAILDELQEVSNIVTLRKKDIMEWQSGNDLQPHADEQAFYLPRLGITAVIKRSRTNLKAIIRREKKRDRDAHRKN